MKAGGLCNVIPVLPQTLVDLVDPLRALLDESNMKARGILQLSPFCGPEQRQNHAVVVGQETHRFARLPSSVALQTEVLFEEVVRFRNVGAGQVQVVDFHGWSSAKASEPS